MSDTSTQSSPLDAMHGARHSLTIEEATDRLVHVTQHGNWDYTEKVVTLIRSTGTAARCRLHGKEPLDEQTIHLAPVILFPRTC